MDVLTQYINDKIAAYVAPIREGTPKGEAIGFSYEKYCASLWALTSLDQKIIADKIKCNYRSLLTWRSQSDFKTMAAQHSGEFSELLINALQGSLNEIIVGDPRKLLIMAAASFKEDAKLSETLGTPLLYSELLCNTIIDILVQRLTRVAESLSNDPNNTGKSQFVVSSFRLLKWLNPRYSSNILLKEKSAVAWNLAKSILLRYADSFIDYVYNEIGDEDSQTLKAVFMVYSELGP